MTFVSTILNHAHKIIESCYKISRLNNQVGLHHNQLGNAKLEILLTYLDLTIAGEKLDRLSKCHSRSVNVCTHKIEHAVYGNNVYFGQSYLRNIQSRIWTFSTQLWIESNLSNTRQPHKSNKGNKINKRGRVWRRIVRFALVIPPIPKTLNFIRRRSTRLSSKIGMFKYQWDNKLQSLKMQFKILARPSLVSARGRG